HLAVGDDVDARAFLVADRQDRRVILRLLQPRLLDTPQVACACARGDDVGEALAVDQPVRLRVASDERGGEQCVHGISCGREGGDKGGNACSRETEVGAAYGMRTPYGVSVWLAKGHKASLSYDLKNIDSVREEMTMK